MTCDFQRVEALFDGTLSEGERAEVRAHLAVCPTCRTWYEALGELHRHETAPADLLDRVMTQVEAQPRRRRPWLRTAATLAACAVLVVLVGFGPLSDLIAPDPGQQAREATAYTADEPATEVDRWLDGIDHGGIADQGRWHLAGELHDLPLERDQTEAVRLWLGSAGIVPEAEGEQGSAYCLTAEEAAALSAAVPTLGLPTDQEVQLYLPTE